jgi:hypothetical protein
LPPVDVADAISVRWLPTGVVTYAVRQLRAEPTEDASNQPELTALNCCDEVCWPLESAAA